MWRQGIAMLVTVNLLRQAMEVQLAYLRYDAGAVRVRRRGRLIPAASLKSEFGGESGDIHMEFLPSWLWFELESLGRPCITRTFPPELDKRPMHSAAEEQRSSACALPRGSKPV